jgi:microcompartment protein CcmK/EutM
LSIDPGGPPSVVQEEQAEKADRFWLVVHQLDEQPGEADRLSAEVAPDQVGAGRGAVALVEERVEDYEHSTKPLRQLVVGRDAVRNPGVLDLVLRAHEPLCHCLRGDHEGACDLDGGQAAERAQGQRNLSLDRERRVATGEDQTQRVVLDPALIVVVAFVFVHGSADLLQLVLADARAA